VRKRDLIEVRTRMKKALLLVIIYSIIALSVGCSKESPDGHSAKIREFILNQDKIVALKIQKDQEGTPFITVYESPDLDEFLEMVSDIPVYRLTKKQDINNMQKGQKLTEQGIYSVNFYAEDKTLLGQFLIWPDGI